MDLSIMTDGRGDHSGLPPDGRPDPDVSARNEISHEPVRPRVIQYQGKRYGIRMEECFWDVLENEARARGCRLNELVHDTYNAEEAQRNKTAYLREHATRWLSEQLEDARRQLEMDRSQIINILRMTRRPALLIENNLCAARFNSPFRDWIGARTRLDLDKDLSRLRVSFQASRRVLEERLRDSGGLSRAEPAAILVPGLAIPLKLDITFLSDKPSMPHMLAVFHNADD